MLSRFPSFKLLAKHLKHEMKHLEESRPHTDFLHVHGTQQKHQSALTTFCLKCPALQWNSYGPAIRSQKNASQETDLLFKRLTGVGS